MKRSSNSWRHRPQEVVSKLRQADEALAKGTPIAEDARSLGVSTMTLLAGVTRTAQCAKTR